MRRVVLTGLCIIGTIATAVGQSATARERAWAAPSSAQARTNPLANRTDVLAGGQRVFAERCRVCHGADGTGGRRGPNLMTTRVQDQSDGVVFWKISSGNTRTGMPTFSFLPESQRWQLVSYLRSRAEH